MPSDTAAQFAVDELSAGKAYTSRANFDAVGTAGAAFYPAFEKNATGCVGCEYGKAFHVMKPNEAEYAKKCHTRSTADSTVGAIKRKFGPDLRPKSEPAMVNEALAKAVCHNITCVIHAMYGLGIDPGFAVKPRCTTNEPPA